MSFIVRDILHSLTHRAGADAEARHGAALEHLDERLGNLASGSGQCALTIRPGDCTRWDGGLQQSTPTVENCRSLIASIADEGSNLIPVVVRPSPKGSELPYELLVGNRRRFAVDWLNRNGRPEIRLNALVVDLSDEEAFRLADIENADREDIAELDRARAYRHALTSYYDGVQSRMADALRLSNSQLSRMLALAELPEEIVGAFATPDELRVRHSEILTPLLRRDEHRAAIVEEAIRIGAEQEQLCTSGDKLIPAAAVIARLREAGSDAPVPPGVSPTGGFGGQELGTIEAFPGGIAVELVVPEFADIDDVLARLKQALIDCRQAARDDDRLSLR